MTKRRLRGLTLIEITVSAAIFSGILLAVTLSFLPAQQAVSVSGVGLDMDRTARRVLAQVRRELRTSGFKADGTLQVEVRDATGPVAPGAAGTEITFRRRLGPDEANDSPTGWSTPVTYRRVDDGSYPNVSGSVPRYRITRTQSDVQAGAPIGVAANVGDLSFRHIPGGDTIVVRIELKRPDPLQGSTPTAPLVKVYEDRIELLNRAAPGS